MMIAERQALKPGTSLSLDGRRCMILGVIGAGTSCIAYKAQMKLTIEEKTASRTIVLKELYPAHQNIIRGKDNSLIIPDSSQAMFEEESESFVKAAILQFEIHNEEDLTNFISDIEVVYELNNTLYSVTGIVSGKSYDKIESENITSILKVGKALSQAISYYHKKGYLNLDIKPANIFNLPETDELVQLFDFNTVCTKDEASQGKFSYSDGYAAPEVKAAKKGGGKLSEVGEQADIYSIGAVIFEKIMGRIPKVADQRAGKRWKLETNPYLKDAVPQLQKGITDLFRKTLAIDKKDRYSSAKELIEDLDELIKLAGIEVFLKNQRISPCTPKDIYIPRKDVLSEIAKRLDEKHILYLHALGGSGKSETAREYAEQYADKYDFIQSVFYSDSLKKTIANLDFVGLKDEDRFAHTDEDIDRLYRYKSGQIYGTNTLLIIDNYDYNADPASEEYKQNHNIIPELKKLNIHILFTTRVKPSDSTECFQLSNLSREKLRELFFCINSTDENAPERIALVDEIIKLSYYHTMTVKLVAMQSAKYLKPLSEYLYILKTSGLNSGIKGRVTNEKDDKSVTMSTVYDHIKVLFDFDHLNEKQKYIMVNACLLPLSGLEADTFSKYIDLKHFDDSSSSDCTDESIEDLVNSGWIEYADTSEKGFTPETKITLHPLICDIVKNELKPEMTENKCGKFYEAFLKLIDEWGNLKAGGKDYLQQENMVYNLFPNIYAIYENMHILAAINSIALSDIKISVSNHIISSGNKIILYFGNKKQLKIPDGVTEIGYSAFSDCSFLTHITIPDSVTKIGYSAFSDCSFLTHITIPDSVTKIGDSAFSGCSSLTHITIPDSVTKIGDSAFSGCSSLAHITIPDSVIEIGDYTFLDCQSLTHITIPNSVTKIGNYAFAYCSDLKDIDLPENIKIGVDTFDGCISLKKFSKPHRYLTELVIPNGVTEIKDHTFEDCIVLGKIIIPDSVTKIGNSAFKNFCSSSPIIIPESIKKIGDNAFESCLSLEQITITGNVTKIGNYAFSYCSNLKHIIISNGVKKIGEHAFANCIHLTKIAMPDSVKEIECGVFSGCSSLEQITIPNSVTEIGDSAFYECSALKNITIPDSVTKIGGAAFAECSALTHITISNSVTKIKWGTFSNCSALTEIHIPNGITKIGLGAFARCYALEQITIPNSVTKIGKKAFGDCNNLSCVVVMNPSLDLSKSMIEYCIDKNGLYKKKENLILKGYKNSTAEQYAQKHSFLFVSLD